MIRALPIAAAAAVLAGCASPVVTRIDSASPVAVAAPASFALAPVPDDLAPEHVQARDMVVAGLRQRGWRDAEAADYLLAVALADRPATANLKAGDDAGRAVAVLAPAATRDNSKGCARRDHRLGITLTERTSGVIAYSGSAAEFHCKAALSESLPHLVSAALDGMGRPSGSRQQERDGPR